MERILDLGLALLVLIAIYLTTKRFVSPEVFSVEGLTYEVARDFNWRPLLKADRIVSGAGTEGDTILVFSDFDCPACRQWAQILEDVRLERDLVIYYRFNPLMGNGPRGWKLALEGACHSRRGALADFYHNIFLAAASKLETCLPTAVDSVKVQADGASAEQFGFTATPMSIANGVIIRGALAQADLERVLESTSREISKP